MLRRLSRGMTDSLVVAKRGRMLTFDDSSLALTLCICPPMKSDSHFVNWRFAIFRVNIGEYFIELFDRRG